MPLHSVGRVRNDHAVLDLPPAHHVERPVALNSEAMSFYRDFEDRSVAMLDDGELTAANAMVKLIRLQQITGGVIEDDDGIRHVVDTSKRDDLRELLSSLPPGEPVTVFALFREDLSAIHEACAQADPPRSSMELSGERKELVEWQKGGADVLAVQIQSGGTGIDLTRARYCVFYSVGFNDGDYQQATCRNHRPGQDKPVTFFHIVAKDTVDPVVYLSNQKKRSVSAEVLRYLDEARSRGESNIPKKG